MEKVFESYRNETDGLVTDAVRTLRTAAVWVWESLVGGRGTVTAASNEAPAAPVVLAPKSVNGRRTLRELGVPDVLAADFEFTLGLLGKVEGGRINGFSFRTTDGVAHALRTETVAAPARLDRAA